MCMCLSRCVYVFASSQGTRCDCHRVSSQDNGNILLCHHKLIQKIFLQSSFMHRNEQNHVYMTGSQPE